MSVQTAPSPISSGSLSSISAVFPGGDPPSQQRRLAEFATILGDLKLATSVWEVLRKDGKSGSVGLTDVCENDRNAQLSYLKEVLPLLLAPSPAINFHASHALSTITSSGTEASASVQLRALTYAVRWEGAPDFLTTPSEGDRWLVWAASSVRGTP